MCFVFLLFARCGDPVRPYIPGTYAAEWVTEFAEGRDTIKIDPVPGEASIAYQITRRTFMVIQGRPEYKIVHWTGTFNSGNKTIIINNNGRIFAFDPPKHEMKMGSTTYKKL